MKYSIILLLLAVLLVSNGFQSSVSGPELVLTVSIKVEFPENERTAIVRMTGKVLDPYDQPVKSAAISSQLNDPSKTSLHISLVYSKEDGSYSDEFIIVKPVTGNYTIYLTASKPGYNDRNIKAPFSLMAGDFNLKISPNSRTIKQGSNASFEIALVPLQGDTLPEVSIRIIGIPERVSYNLINKSATIPKTFTLIIITRENTPVGKYNFTILGDAEGFSQTTWAIVEVSEMVQPTSEPPPVNNGNDLFSFTFLHQIIFVVIFIAIISLVIIKYLVRKKKSDDVNLDPKKDKTYLGIARALARIEELRAADKLIEETYRKLKKEYEDKLEKARKKD
ncbi:COG1470 family protein [[Eubacterium] cellulosolvens]